MRKGAVCMRYRHAVGSLALSIALLLTGCSDTQSASDSSQTVPTNAPKDLSAQELTKELTTIAKDVTSYIPGTVGIALYTDEGLSYAGTIDAARAWSTNKVPLSLAAVSKGVGKPSDIELALTQSDNDAAQRLRNALGGQQPARTAILQEVHDYGSNAALNAAGEVMWSVKEQSYFALQLSCSEDKPATVVKKQMGNITPSQSFGLGTVHSPMFKGGWGPEKNGKYFVRQLGILDTSTGPVGIAIAARPTEGSFLNAQNMLSELAQRIHKIEDLEGSCNTKT